MALLLLATNFKEFVRRNGIRHRTSAPYHPATNGLAERAVQVVKTGLRKNTEGDMGLRLARLLFKYRNTPHTTTGVTPAELLLGRKPRCHIDLLHPDKLHGLKTNRVHRRLHMMGNKRSKDHTPRAPEAF